MAGSTEITFTVRLHWMAGSTEITFTERLHWMAGSTEITFTVRLHWMAGSTEITFTERLHWSAGSTEITCTLFCSDIYSYGNACCGIFKYRGRNCRVVEFKTTYAISVNHH
jgi:head-tail adaptor